MNGYIQNIDFGIVNFLEKKRFCIEIKGISGMAELGNQGFFFKPPILIACNFAAL